MNTAPPGPTWMPIALRCISFCISRTRPDAASSALLGTQPRFTQVPPMSWPSMTATFMPWGVGKGGDGREGEAWAREAAAPDRAGLRWQA
jgi:hypothetical protein